MWNELIVDWIVNKERDSKEACVVHEVYTTDRLHWEEKTESNTDLSKSSFTLKRYTKAIRHHENVNRFQL